MTASDPDIFLKPGKQTGATPNIQEVADSVPGKGLDFVFGALRWLEKNLERRGFDEKLFRQRTAEEIITSEFSTGCTDSALAFVALCRAKVIPATYLEVVDRRWLEKRIGDVVGHVFSRIFVDGVWYLVDPHLGSVSIKPVPDKNRWVVLGEGLDSWDLGIRNLSDLKERVAGL